MDPAGTKLFAVLDHLPLGVFVLRPDGIVAEWNRCIEQWTGISRADIVGRPIGDFSEPLGRPQYQKRLDAVFQTGAPLILSSQLHGQIIPSVLPDGRTRIQQAMVTALPRNGSDDYWALFAIQDVTDLTYRIRAHGEMRDEAVRAKKLAEQKAEDLKATQLELEQFVYAASHDLQEPLRTLISYGTLLAEDIGDDLSQDAREDIGYIQTAARRMQILITDLLELSRTGRTPMQPTRVSLQECFDVALQSLAKRVEETSASIRSAPLPEVLGESTLLSQTFQNLLGNAMKFVPQGVRPQIEVTAKRDSSQWTVGVQDNGIGIPAEYAAQIFQPFKRLHGMTEYKGSGIGLAICKKAVERHGGSIWVESHAGQGAHFRFTLPAAAENEKQPVT